MKLQSHLWNKFEVIYQSRIILVFKIKKKIFDNLLLHNIQCSVSLFFSRILLAARTDGKKRHSTIMIATLLLASIIINFSYLSFVSVSSLIPFIRIIYIYIWPHLLFCMFFTHPIWIAHINTVHKKVSCHVAHVNVPKQPKVPVIVFFAAIFFIFV